MATKKEVINPFDSMSKARKDEQEQLVESTKNPTTEPKKKAPAPKKKTVSEETRGKGRPCIDESKGKKRDYCKTINIAVDSEKIEQVKEYALQGRGLNLTQYINLLIENDMKKNLEKYKAKINANDFE